MEFIIGKIQEIEDESVTLVIESRCNNHCSFCMIEPIMGKMSHLSPEEFRSEISRIQAQSNFKRLILSGAEVTLNKDLDKYVEYAKQNGNFRHIQLQTNARKFSDIDFCRKIITAGVDEFFISVLGTRKIHNELTGADSFDETMDAIKNLSGFGCEIIVNVVVTDKNHKILKDIVEMLLPYKIKSIWFWNYWPMNPSDTKGLVTDLNHVASDVRSAVTFCENNSIFPILKSFPACMFPEFRKYKLMCSTKTQIDRTYWESYAKNRWQCPYSKECKIYGSGCEGVSEAFLKKYGVSTGLLSSQK